MLVKMLHFRNFLTLFCALALFNTQAQDPEKTIQVNQERDPYELSNSEYFLIEAAKYVFLEDYDKAIAHLDKAIEIDENNHAAFFKKAEILSLQEDYNDALLSIEKAIAVDKNNRYYYLLAAKLHQALNQPNEASKTYELMLDNTSGWEVDGEAIVNAFVTTNQLDFALTLLPELLAYYPNYPSLYLKKAEIEIELGKQKDALATLTKAFDKFPEDPTVLKAYVRTLSAQGENGLLEGMLRQVMNENYRAKILLAEFLINQLRLEEIDDIALSLFQDENSSLETKVLSIGYLFEAKNIKTTTIDSLQTLLSESYPDQSIVFENGGYVYEKLAIKTKGQQRTSFQTKAINSYKKAAQLDPNNFEAWLKVFDYEIKQERWNTLLSDVEYLLDLYPNQAILFYYYAEANRGLNELEDALDLVEQGLRIGGRNELIKSIMLAEKAKIYALQQKNDEADALFNQALNTQNVDERAIYAYAQWLNQVNPKATIELMEVFKEGLSPSEQWVAIELHAYIIQGEFKKAEKRIKDFFEEQPAYDNGKLFELYGDILLALGDVDEALVQWRKALSLGDFSEKLEEKIDTNSIN